MVYVDTIDGIAGGKDTAHRLMIMRDSHIGAIGATGLILALGLRYAGLVNLPPGSREWLLLSFPALGRWAMVVGAWKVVYARPEGGVAKAFIEYISIRDVIFATTTLGIGMFYSSSPRLCDASRADCRSASYDSWCGEPHVSLEGLPAIFLALLMKSLKLDYLCLRL